MNPSGQWRELKSTLPWVNAFNEKMRNSSVPILNGREVVIATDSSGLHQQSPFEVLGILIFDFGSAMHWEALRQSIRRNILKDSRRMSFKKLDDSVRQRALVPFLLAADQLNGLCLNIAIHKQINLHGDESFMHEQLKKSGVLKARWTSASFERMTRTTHFVALSMAGLCGEGQDVCWISDEDEMFESPQKSEDTLRILSVFNKQYINWPLGKLSAGTTKLDEGDRFEEDFAAIADLTAGAFAELVTKLKRSPDGSIGEAMINDFDSQLSEKTDLLLSWLIDQTQKLKRCSIVFDRRTDGKIRLAGFQS